MAAEGMQLSWRWNGSTISTNLDVIWGMSVYAKFGFVTVGHGYFSHGVSETPPIEVVKMEHS